jgi:hypothetical protein
MAGVETEREVHTPSGRGTDALETPSPQPTPAAVGFVSHCHPQAGPPPTILIETMSFSQTRPQLSLDTFKSHDNLVDPNVTAFTPNDRKSYFLDTSVSLFFPPNHDWFSGSNFLQKEQKGDFFDEDDGDLTARTAYPPTPQLTPPDSRTWWQKVCVSLHSFFASKPILRVLTLHSSSYQTQSRAVSMLSQY